MTELSAVDGKVSGVDSGSGTLGELCARLGVEDQSAFVRAVVREDGGHRPVWYVDAVVGPPAAPAQWQARVWAYEPVTFVAAQVSSRALAAALDRDDAQVLPLGRYDLVLPVLSEQLPWRRNPSRARYNAVSLPWPALTYEPWRPDQPLRTNLSDFLIGDDCPSFATYDAAFRAFFYSDFSNSPPQQAPSGFGVVRVIERAAWLDRVLITPTHIDVHVDGSDINGARVELNSSTYRADAQISETGHVQISLPDGLPPGAWLFLSRDRRWLDYRAIGDYQARGELAGAGVDVQLPEDPEAEIQALLAQGEGQYVEFKRQLPEDTVEAKRTVFKTVAAFANGQGGSIVFGVEKDEATVCGLTSLELVKERDRLAQLARSIVTPTPVIEVRQYDLEGKTLLVLAVEPGTDAPYGVTPRWPPPSPGRHDDGHHDGRPRLPQRHLHRDRL